MDADRDEAGDRPRAPALEGEFVRLFDRDPGLLADMDDATARFLHEHQSVPSVRLGPGPWHPPTHRASARQWLGLIVLEGFLVRPLTAGHRRIGDLAGPGDLLRPWDRLDWEGLVQTPSAYTVLSPVTLAVLDQRFSAVAGRFPQLMGALLSRSHRRSWQLAAAVAIGDAGTTEDKVRSLLTYAADRWGRSEDGGRLLPGQLTPRALAWALDAGEPTVRAALDRLSAAGALQVRGERFVMSAGAGSGRTA
jgi:hypothetical protein